MFERCSNSPEPLSDKNINPIDQVINENSSETSNLYNMTSEVPQQDSNGANKNKEHENVCPIKFKLKEKYVSIETFIMIGLGLEPIL